MNKTMKRVVMMRVVMYNDEYDPCEEFETKILTNEFLFDSLII